MFSLFFSSVQATASPRLSEGPIVVLSPLEIFTGKVFFLCGDFVFCFIFWFSGFRFRFSFSFSDVDALPGDSTVDKDSRQK